MQSSNIKEREYSKFIDSPTRPNESAIETVSYTKPLPVGVQIINQTIAPMSIQSLLIPVASQVLLKSRNATKFRLSFDSLNWLTVPIGGVVTLSGNVTAQIDNQSSKPLVLEMLLYG